MEGYENVLIVGSGGREHALGWKIAQNKNIKRIYFANGNGGTFQNIQVLPTEIDKISEFAKNNNCFTIVGPENPLAMGIVDLFNEKNLSIFGPTKNASRLETSKKYAKEFMKKYLIPTSEFEIFDDSEKANSFIDRINFDVVIKADGLASGKGVIVTNSKQEARQAISLLLDKKTFGKASEQIIIEKKINGEELSLIAICDGKNFTILQPVKDHKRIFDHDIGPNTGGMGSFSPVPNIGEEDIKRIADKVFKPTLDSMISEGNPFKGFLYAGLMIEKQTEKPYVLEFNVRMGDPECQVLMMRMQSNIFDYIEASQYQSLDTMPEIIWNEKVGICVIMASKGYPDKYEIGYSIRGLKDTDSKDTMIFHSGTKLNHNKEIVTNGGRVLGVTTLGYDFEDAISKVYKNVEKISWGNNQQHYRKDIGRKAISNDD